MNVINADLTQPILLGRQGEHGVTQIVFDLSGYVKKYGDGVAQLTVKRSSDPLEYAVWPERVENTAVWEIGAEWTQNAGQGYCYLHWFVDDDHAKFGPFKTMVRESNSACDAPEPQAGYLDQVVSAGTQAVKASEQAKRYAETTVVTAKRFDEAYVARIEGLVAGAEAAAKRAAEYDPKPPYINKDTNTWMEWDGTQYVDTGKLASVEVDDTLTVKGKAADSRATGNALANKLDFVMRSPLTQALDIGLPNNEIEGYTAEYGRYVFGYDHVSDSMYFQGPAGIYDNWSGDANDTDVIPLRIIPGNLYYFEGDKIRCVWYEEIPDPYHDGHPYYPDYVRHEKEFAGAEDLEALYAQISEIYRDLDDLGVWRGEIRSVLEDELAKKLNRTGGTLTGPLYYKSKSNEFLRTDNIVNWAIGNMDEWTPFFSYFNIARVQKMEYKGTGTYGEENAKKLTFDFQPKIVIVVAHDQVHVDGGGTEKVNGFNEVLMVAPYGTPAAISSRYYGSGDIKAYPTHLTWNGKTVSWWGTTDTRHLNCVRWYYVFAIG